MFCDVTPSLPRRLPSQFHFGSDTDNIEKCFTHVHYVCLYYAPGLLVRIVLLLMTIMNIAGYAIHLNCIKDTQCNLITAISVLKRFVTLTLEVSYASIVTMINVIHRRSLTLA